MSSLRLFRGIVNHTTHLPMVRSAFAGILVFVMLPVRLHWRLDRCASFMRRVSRHCRMSHLAVLTLQRSRRAQVPSAWVTRYKTTCRQTSRLIP